jgi:hypothetical protein
MPSLPVHAAAAAFLDRNGTNAAIVTCPGEAAYQSEPDEIPAGKSLRSCIKVRIRATTASGQNVRAAIAVHIGRNDLRSETGDVGDDPGNKFDLPPAFRTSLNQ